MRRIIKSVRHAASLLRNLGLRRFSIVLVCWSLQRHRRLLGPLFKLARGPVNRDKISHDPVLIYQMAKVGSTSLMYSLQYAYLKVGLPSVALYHVHTLTNLDAHEQLARESSNPAELHATVQGYRKLRKDFEARPQEHWSAISMVREPVLRHVSDYFHHIDHHLPNWRRRWREHCLTVDEVLQSFLTVADHADYWFDAEIKSVLGIDVFSEPFPHESGYGLYSRSSKVTLAVIRLEDMDRVAGQAMEQLLGIKEFKLYSFNSASESGYRDLYQQFKAKPLPTWYLEKAYSGRLAQHFYSKAERDQFAKKWTDGPTPVP
jgi:hypothetical protein